MRARRLALLLAAPLAFGASTATPVRRAHAQTVAPDKPATRAAELKKKGDDAMQALAFADALAAYNEAYALAPDPALLYNRGIVYRALGAFPEALEEFKGFAAQAAPELRARVPHLDELITDVRSRVALLRVSCNVAGARVMVRDKVIGTTPVNAPIAVAAGPAMVEVSAEGYTSFQRTIDLRGQATFELEATLAARERSAVLAIVTTPPGATILVDEKVVGTSPSDALVGAGAHRVIARRDGYEDATESVVLDAGARRDVTLSLRRGSALYARWWFWAGVGALVVGGTVLTVALVTERSAGTGDIAPGQVTAPLLQF